MSPRFAPNKVNKKRDVIFFLSNLFFFQTTLKQYVNFVISTVLLEQCLHLSLNHLAEFQVRDKRHEEVIMYSNVFTQT